MDNKIVDFEQARLRRAGMPLRPVATEPEWQEVVIPKAQTGEAKVVY
ncbi:MAG TPA: hypothetical protein V6D47_00735 [Oscillatoriaceae cyanobacterium]